jgi:hypothetical protein
VQALVALSRSLLEWGAQGDDGGNVGGDDRYSPS